MLTWREEAGWIVPRWLLEEDEPWLAALVRSARRHELMARRRFARIAFDETAAAAPASSLRLAMHVLLGDACGLPRPALRERLARRAAWTERALTEEPREAVMSRVAQRLGVGVAELERALVADLPEERPVGFLPAGFGARELRLRVNLRLAQAFVARSQSVTIEMAGHVRRVVQHARWQGLLCTVFGSTPGSCRVELSGPLSVLRTTRLYARALCSVLPLLPGCGRFRLAASCRLAGRWLRLELRECAPIEATRAPRRHDSRLEARFEQDVRTLAPDWEVVREPEAILVAGTIIFPDFALGPLSEPSRRVLVEVVGWWTAEYVAAKLARLRQVSGHRIITCVREGACGSSSLDGLDAIPFRGRVDAAAVLDRARRLLAVR